MANNKALFLKWMKILFYIHCVSLVAYLIGLLPLIGSLFGWVAPVVTVISIFCLYSLAPVNERYKKAAILSAVAFVLSVIMKFSGIGFIIGLIFIVCMVCNLVAMYQEYGGHSDVLVTIDNKLSKNWHTLFNWQVFGSIVVAIIGAPVIIVAAVAFLLDANVISILTTVLISCFDIILDVFYLVFLKRTFDACERYEHWVDDVVAGNQI